MEKDKVIETKKPFQEETASEPPASRAGFVALVGAPNAGKSTLFNRIIGTKVAIVTHKVQTTRAVLRGIVLRENTQLIFLDTPGLFHPKRTLDTHMVHAAWEALKSVDIACLLLDATGEAEKRLDQKTLSAFTQISATKILILTKIDLVRREKLLPLTESLTKTHDFEQVFMLSAKTGSGVEDLLAYLSQKMPLSPHLYPDDSLTDISTRLLAAEITREQLLLRLHQELPYMLTVETTDISRFKDRSLRLEQVIYVGRAGHRPMVLGKKGQTIREISLRAREEMTRVFERKVHLFITVQVKPDWADDPQHLHEIGLA